LKQTLNGDDDDDDDDDDCGQPCILFSIICILVAVVIYGYY